MNYEEPQQQEQQPLFYSPLPFLSPDVATASLSGSPALNTPAASTANGMYPSPVQHTNTNTALNQVSWQMHKNDFDLLMDPALYFDGNPISVLLDKSRAVPEATTYPHEQVFNVDSLKAHYHQPLDFAYTPETTMDGPASVSMQDSPAIQIPASDDTPMIPQHQQLTFYGGGGGGVEYDNAHTIQTPYLEEHHFSSTGNSYHHDNYAQNNDTSSLFPPLPSDEVEFQEERPVQGEVKEEEAQDEQEEQEVVQETRHAKKPRRKAPKFHPCPECHRTFDRKYNMTTHLRTHDKARKKPFQCRVGCKKSFDRKHDRERHEASVHRQERLYTCGRCRASFARRDALHKHTDMCC